LKKITPKKALIIQFKQIGDVLMSTPTIRALAASPEAWEVDLLTQSPANQVMEHNKHLRKILLYPSKAKTKDLVTLIRNIRSEHYHVVIDFQGSPKSALIALLSGAPTRLGFPLRGRSIAYTQSIETPDDIRYSAAQKLYFLSQLGINSLDSKLEMEIAQDDRDQGKKILQELNVDFSKPLMSISPVSRRDYKVWPAKNFAEICDYLIERYEVQILFLWGPGEYEFVDAVRKEMKNQTLADYEIPTLRETYALLELVDLHIGNDNGPMHFAIAAEKPTISIFGRPEAINWTPSDSSRHVAIEQDPGCKTNCKYPNCDLECIRRIETSVVVKAIDQQMESIQLKK